MGANPQSTAQRIADNLVDQTREHKKLERRHRNLAQRNLATLAELEAFCRAMGIPVERRAARDE